MSDMQLKPPLALTCSPRARQTLQLTDAEFLRLLYCVVYTAEHMRSKSICMRQLHMYASHQLHSLIQHVDRHVTHTPMSHPCMWQCPHVAQICIALHSCHRDISYKRFELQHHQPCSDDPVVWLQVARQPKLHVSCSARHVRLCQIHTQGRA